MKNFLKKCIFFIALLLLSSSLGSFFVSSHHLIPEKNISSNLNLSYKEVIKYNDGVLIESTKNNKDYLTFLGAGYNMSRYTRYWHGHIPVLKLFLIFFSYNSITVFFNILMSFILIFLFYLIIKKIGLRLAVSFLITSFVFYKTYRLNSFFIIPVTFITLTSLLFILQKKRLNIPVLFFIIGACTSFFDLLSIPLITWGFPICFIVAICINKSTWTLFKTIVISALSWIGGYGGIWTIKWIFSSFVLSRNVVQDALNSIIFRIDGWHYNHIDTIKSNFSYFSPFSINQVLFGLIACFGLLFIYLYIKKQKIKPQTILFLLIALSPYVWYLVLNNHSAIHAGFTYQIQAITLFGILLFFTYNLFPENKEFTVVEDNHYSLNKTLFFSVAGIFCVYALVARQIEKQRELSQFYSYNWKDTCVITNKPNLAGGGINVKNKTTEYLWIKDNR